MTALKTRFSLAATVVAMAVAACAPAAQSPGATTPATSTPASTATSVPASEAAEVEQADVTFVFSFGYSGHRSPYLLADSMGFFEEEGLNVEILEGSGSSNALDQLATGQVEFAELEFPTVVLGASQGRDVMTVATVLQTSPQCVTSFVDLGIEEPKDLEGNSMVAIPGASDTLMLTPLFEINDVDPSAVEIISADFQTRTNIFLTREADTMPTFANDSFVRLQQQGHDIQCFLYADFGVDLLGNGLAVQRSFAEENPNTVAAFIRALKRGFEHARENPEESIAALLDVADLLEEDEELAVLEATWPFTESEATEENGWGYTAPEDAERSVELLVDADMVEDPGDPSEYFDNSYLPSE